jgi:hypothetical protein
LEERVPSGRFPGSVGDAIYMSRAPGIFSATQTVTIDSAFLFNHYAYYSTQYKAYETSVTAYNTLKDAYNAAAAKEKARRADFLKAWLTYELPVPVKPCPPDQPFAYSGPLLKFKEAVDGTTWASIVSGTSKDAFLAYSTTN